MKKGRTRLTSPQVIIHYIKKGGELRFSLLPGSIRIDFNRYNRNWFKIYPLEIASDDKIFANKLRKQTDLRKKDILK